MIEEVGELLNHNEFLKKTADKNLKLKKVAYSIMTANLHGR